MEGNELKYYQKHEDSKEIASIALSSIATAHAKIFPKVPKKGLVNGGFDVAVEHGGKLRKYHLLAEVHIVALLVLCADDHTLTVVLQSERERDSWVESLLALAEHWRKQEGTDAAESRVTAVQVSLHESACLHLLTSWD